MSDAGRGPDDRDPPARAVGRRPGDRKLPAGTDSRPQDDHDLPASAAGRRPDDREVPASTDSRPQDDHDPPASAAALRLDDRDLPASAAGSPGPAPALAAAARWRALALLFHPPDDDRAREIAALAAECGEAAAALRDLAPRLGAACEPDYHRLLGAGGACPASESAWMPSLGGPGALLGDIAAFHAAFGFDAARELRAAPDHIALELGFLAWLAMREAYALYTGQADGAERCREAAARFRADHLDRWLGALCERLASVDPEGPYGAVGRVTAALVR